MKCDNCKKEQTWLEMIGSYYICHKCISKNKILGLVLRTKMDSFSFLLKKLKIVDYAGLIAVSKKDVEKYVDLKELEE